MRAPSCRARLQAIQWKTEGARTDSREFACPDCGSKLIRQLDPDNVEQAGAAFMGSACGEEPDIISLIVAGIEEAYGAEAHIAAKDGGEPPVGTCPECGEETYVFADGGCALCGFDMPDDARCAVCD